MRCIRITALKRDRMKPTPRLAAVALALSASALGSAWAAPIGVYTSHFVTGQATAGAPGDGRAGAYQCNTQTTVQDLAGCGVVTSPGFDRVSAGGATTYGGTAPGSASMTAFNAQARANEFSYVYPNNVQTVQLGAGYSQAYAAADLADASLHASVSNNANLGYVSGSARADLHDVVQLQVAGAGASTVTRVLFQFAVDGTVMDDGQTTVYGQPGSGVLTAQLRLDDLSSAHQNTADYWVFADTEWAISNGTLAYQYGRQDIRGAHVGGSWSTVGLGLMVFDGWMDIVGSSATINPTLSLSLQCDIGLQCDYGHTARFSFVGLPGSVSYTSASGVFLTAGAGTPTDPNGVPEPASAALVIAALAGLSVATRRRA